MVFLIYHGKGLAVKEMNCCFDGIKVRYSGTFAPASCKVKRQRVKRLCGFQLKKPNSDNGQKNGNSAPDSCYVQIALSTLKPLSGLIIQHSMLNSILHQACRIFQVQFA